MKWKKVSSVTAVSDCGRYEVRISVTTTGKQFFNAWRTSDGKHIEASFQKRLVKEACEKDAAK